MNTYAITWRIDLDADSPREAAEEALQIQRNPDSIANVFRRRGFERRNHVYRLGCGGHITLLKAERLIQYKFSSDVVQTLP
jgi:hypothetical protein